jgi:Zn-finger nucleic acid-binding protein
MVFRGDATSCLGCKIPMVAQGTDLPTELCQRCGAAFVETATFLEMLRHERPMLGVEELMEFNDGTPRRPCPRCGAQMAIVWLELLQLDECPDHGVWFDPGELKRALVGELVPPQVADKMRQKPKRKG